MKLPPGFGFAAKITTTAGTIITVSDQKRGFYGPDDRYYAPLVLKPLRLSGALDDPSVGFPVWDRLVIEMDNTRWRIKDHLGTDRLEGAEVVIYIEENGTFSATTDIFKTMFVAPRRSVRATATGLRITCIGSRAFYCDGQFLPKRVMDEFSAVKNADDDDPDDAGLSKMKGRRLAIVFGEWTRGLSTVGPLQLFTNDIGAATDDGLIIYDSQDAAGDSSTMDNDINATGDDDRIGFRGTVRFVNTDVGGNEFHTEPESGRVPRSALSSSGGADAAETEWRLDESEWNDTDNWLGGATEQTDTPFPGVWDATKFDLYAGGDGVRSKTVSDAVVALHGDEKAFKGEMPLTAAATIYHSYCGMPVALIDLDAFGPGSINPSLPQVRRRIDRRQSVVSMLKSLYQETRVLEFETSEGKVSWRNFDLRHPSPPAMTFHEGHLIREPEYLARNFGDYFNCANARGTEGTGFQFDPENGRPAAARSCNDDAVTANDGVEVFQELEVDWLRARARGPNAPGGNQLEDYRDYRLFLAGIENDTVKVEIRKESDLRTQIFLRPGDVIQFGYRPSRVDTSVDVVWGRSTYWLVRQVAHDLRSFISTLVLWRVEAPLFRMMGASQTFPAEVDPTESSMLPWDTSWTRDQKRFATIEGPGGYLSETVSIIDTTDPDPDLAKSPLG